MEAMFMYMIVVVLRHGPYIVGLDISDSIRYSIYSAIVILII